MKKDRWFYTASAALFLATMLLGFRHFVANGTAADGNPVQPAMLRIDLIHGIAIASWYVLFLIQSLLISVRSHRLHFQLGWSAVAVALTIAITSPLVATRSVRIAPPGLHFFGMEYSRFLLVMYAEIALFTGFVVAAILARKKPRTHRAAMLLASLVLLPGATARLPFLYPVFGDTSWLGLFGPVFCIGALLLLVRSVLTRTLDLSLAKVYATMILGLAFAEGLSLTQTWATLVSRILTI